MNQWLNSLGWMACVVYSTIPSFWFMVHPFASRWRKHRTSPYRILVPGWIAMWLIMAALTWRWRNIAVYSTPWTWIAAGLLFAAGIWLYAHSGSQFTPAQLGGLPEVRRLHPDRRLVTTGVRSRVRHPVYLAHLCEMLAWSIGTGLAVCFGLTTFAILTGVFMIRMEEAELVQRFGEEYRQYQQRVPALIPSIGKLQGRG